MPKPETQADFVTGHTGSGATSSGRATSALKAPGIADERRRYLFEQTPRRNQQHVQELRKLYEGMCQLCGWNPKYLYRRNLYEAHHVHWLSRGGDDALHNLVLICPNHHRAIHRTDAPFDWADASFVFPRNRESVQIFRHALQAK